MIEFYKPSDRYWTALGFAFEVLNFLAAGINIARGNYKLFYMYLAIGGLMAFIVGRALIEEGKKVQRGGI
jgi:hypothetical protein